MIKRNSSWDFFKKRTIMDMLKTKSTLILRVFDRDRQAPGCARVAKCVGALLRPLLFMAVISLNFSLPVSGAELEYYIARRVAEQTNAAAGWVSVTGTAETGTTASANGWIDNTNFTVGERYLILCWGSYHSSSANGNAGLRVTHGGVAFSESQSIQEPDQAVNPYKFSYFWFTVWTAANEDLEVQLYRTANTTRVEDITLVAINAEDLITNGDLQYTIDTAGGALSNVLTTRVSTTWTPANNNDTWLVMSYSRANINAATGDQYEQRLVLAGTNMTTNIIDGEDATDTPVYSTSFARTFTNALTTIALQIRYAVGAHAWLAGGIFALRLNAFESFAISGVAGTQVLNAGDDTYNTVETITLAPRMTGHWIVTGGFVNDDNDSRTTARIQLDNTTDITYEHGGHAWATADLTPFIAGDVASYEARVPYTWDLDARETNNTTDPEAEDAWMAAFSLSTFDRTRKNTVINY